MNTGRTSSTIVDYVFAPVTSQGFIQDFLLGGEGEEPMVDIGFSIGGICARIARAKFLTHTHYVIDHAQF